MRSILVLLVVAVLCMYACLHAWRRRRLDGMGNRECATPARTDAEKWARDTVYADAIMQVIRSAATPLASFGGDGGSSKPRYRSETSPGRHARLTIAGVGTRKARARHPRRKKRQKARGYSATNLNTGLL